MAKRPQLGTFAQPVSTFVQPVAAEKTVAPFDEQAVRETYAFADAFAGLSESMVKVASTLKTESNIEQLRLGQEMVNSSRKSYADLISSGQIDPSENPWLAVGAQEAAGAIEASKARAEFARKYEADIANNPELLGDQNYFDSLASSFVAGKSSGFGGAKYLTDSFFKNFNPFLLEQSQKHSIAVGKYRQQKIIDSLKLKVDEVLSEVGKSKRFGKRPDGSYKDVGYYGPLIGRDGSVITEMSIGTEINGQEMDIPLLVPGLSAEARETIVFGDTKRTANELLASIPAKDRDLIFRHAEERVNQGKSPFFSTLNDEQISNLQEYLDEMGKNMGLPRVANIAVALHLIELMKESGMTYEAEALLNGLETGTGMVASLPEVKLALSEAEADISKNRFTIKNNQEKTDVGIFVEKEFNRIVNASAGGGKPLPDLDTLQALLDKQQTFTPEDRAKAISSYIEMAGKALTQGQNAYSQNTRRRVFTKMSEVYTDMNRGVEVPYWAEVKIAFNDTLLAENVSLESGPAKELEREASVHLLQDLDAKRDNAIAAFNAENGTSLKSLYPNEQEARNPKVVAFTERQRGIYNMNRILLGIHFNNPELHADFTRAAISGISVTIERGLDPRLEDLVYAYRNSSRGFFPWEDVLGKGPGSERLQKFVVAVNGLMDRGMPIREAARDTAQTLSLEYLDPMSLTDLVSKGEDLAELTNTIDSLYEEFLENQSMLGSVFENFVPWAGWSNADINPDSRGIFRHEFAKSYHQALKASGSHRQALETAKEQVYGTVFLDGMFMVVEGSLIPKAPYEKYKMGRDYLANFIKYKTDIPDATLVVVGTDGVGEPILALRTKEGNSINNEYYTMYDLDSEESRIGVARVMKAREEESRKQQRERQLNQSRFGPKY